MVVIIIALTILHHRCYLSALASMVSSAPYMSSSTRPVCPSPCRPCCCISGRLVTPPKSAPCPSPASPAPPAPSRNHRINAVPLGLGAVPRAWSNAPRTPDLPRWPWCSARPRSLARAQASVAFLMSLRSLAMRLKEDMVDGPRLVPPVIQWASRAFLERAEEGLLASSALLDMLVADGCGLSASSVGCEFLYLWCYYLLGTGLGFVGVTGSFC